MTKKQEVETGAKDVHWDLSVLYGGLDDHRFESDVKELEDAAAKFNADFRGSLSETLGDAINTMAGLTILSNKVGVYLYLNFSTHLSDDGIKAKMAEVEMRLAKVSGEYAFFEIEVAALSEADLERLKEESETVLRHISWIEDIRRDRPHMLSEEVEAALSKRSPFSAGAWASYFDEMASRLRFEVDGEEKTLAETLHELTEEGDAERRASLMKTLNSGLAGEFAEYSAQTLYMVAGKKRVEDCERHYPTPMSARNVSNKIPDAVVEALHHAVHEVGAAKTRRYYRLKARHLGLERLRWSDRNAPMPFRDTSITPWDEAVRLVERAYRSFSPTLADLVVETVEARRIDAPPYEGKDAGAYNYSVMVPPGTPLSWTFLNYQGSARDVMTLAHELGHGVHGLLAAEAQGPLMFRAPMAYAETASIFGEMTTFNYLESRLVDSGDTASRLALVMGKLDDTMNTIVRQIGFSDFEREVHASGRRMSIAELDAVWLKTAQGLYGEDGDIFTYENAEHLWCYVGHFHRPFYVYAYAFGDLLTRSLYAKRDEFGDRFEPLYLDMLRAGGTKDVVELTKPFGLDSTDAAFWALGVEEAMKPLETAEALSKDLFGIELHD